MKIKFREAILTYISGFAFSLTPAKSGELMKAELMNKRHGFNRKTVSFVVVVERAFDMVSHIIIGGISALFVAQQYVLNLWWIFILFMLGATTLFVFRN